MVCNCAVSNSFTDVVNCEIGYSVVLHNYLLKSVAQGISTAENRDRLVAAKLLRTAFGKGNQPAEGHLESDIIAQVS